MSRVVVVGAGAAGLAAAARLGRLHHEVVVVEQDATVGGRWRPTEVTAGDGLRFRFHAQPTAVRLPAAIRDLFLKTGKRLERAVDLRRRDHLDAHVFADGSRMAMPNDGQAAAAAAVADAFGPAAGQEWAEFLDVGERWWEVARSPLLESPGAAGAGGLPRLRRLRRDARLSPRRRLRSTTRRLSDVRLRAMADHYGAAAGWPVGAAPATVTALPYVEQAFRVWSAAGGPFAVVEAIHDRALAAGAVAVMGTRAVRVTSSRAGVDGVLLDDGRKLPADVVVSDVGDAAAHDLLPAGHGLPPARPGVGVDVLLGLRGRTSDEPARHVLHGTPTLTVWVDPEAAPDDHEAVVVSLPPGETGLTVDDVVTLLATRGHDVRDRVVASGMRRVTGAHRRPTFLPRPGPSTAIAGLFTVGRSSAFGHDLSLTVMSAAAVADQVGRA